MPNMVKQGSGPIPRQHYQTLSPALVLPLQNNVSIHTYFTSAILVHVPCSHSFKKKTYDNDACV